MTISPKSEDFDLVVIGGGVHGLVTAGLAAERGMSTLLLDTAPFGSQTSAAWFGILHGGLRYLQSMDLRRYRTALRERRWFLRTFGEHAANMPFLMPLYDRGMKRRPVFRLAFLLDAALSFDRNVGVSPGLHLGRGRTYPSRSVADISTYVRETGLAGGAVWHEAVVPDLNALTQAIVRWSRTCGATLRHGCAATGLDRDASGAVAGLTYRDADGQTHQIRTHRVINATGPWAEELARRLDPGHRPTTGLSLAFNLVLRKPPPSTHGLAISPPEGQGDMLFVYPKGQTETFAGTWYIPATKATVNPVPAHEDVEAFRAAVGASLPGYGIETAEIAAMPAGLLPTTAPGETRLLNTPLIIDHGRNGGPRGLVTQIGTKYTTARRTAELTLRTL